MTRMRWELTRGLILSVALAVGAIGVTVFSDGGGSLAEALANGAAGFGIGGALTVVRLVLAALFDAADGGDT